MKSEWKTMDDKKIFYCDYRNFNMDIESLKEEIVFVENEICKEPEKSVLALLDVVGTIGTPEIMVRFKESSTITRPYIKKNAVIGLEGIQKMLAEGVARFSGQSFKAFDDEEAAMTWLVEDQ